MTTNTWRRYADSQTTATLACMKHVYAVAALAILAYSAWFQMATYGTVMRLERIEFNRDHDACMTAHGASADSTSCAEWARR
jgi:hypothetical protein